MVPEHGEGSQADSASVHSYPAFIRQHPATCPASNGRPVFLATKPRAAKLCT